MWCSKSATVARVLCEKLVLNHNPLDALKLSLNQLTSINSTCMEDVGRQIIALDDVKKCIEILEKLDINEIAQNKNIALLVFAILFTYYRRLRIEDRMKEILYRFKDIIEDTPVYVHSKAMWIEKSDIAPFDDRLVIAINYEIEALQKDTNYIGAQHKLADLIAQALEEGWEAGDCEKLDKKCIPEKLVREAKNILRKLAYEIKYPRAYFTLARFYLIEGMYKDAIDLLNNAIRLENPMENDYYLRLGEYYNTLFLARSMQRLERNIERISNRFSEQSGNLIENFRSSLEKYEARLISFVSIYIGLITIIFTMVFTVSSPNTTFQEALLLELIIIAIVYSLILLLLKYMQKR